MLKASEINAILTKNKQLLEDLGFIRKGRGLGFANYRVKFIFSKHGYDEEYGLDFFLRAENENAPKDRWGNMLDPFAEGNVLDFRPSDLYRLDSSAKEKISTVYPKNRNLNKVGDKFTAWTAEELEQVIVLLLPNLGVYLENSKAPLK